MVRSAFFTASLALLLLATSVHAGPISVRIDDHDFTFGVAVDAVYAYDGNPRRDTERSRLLALASKAARLLPAFRSYFGISLSI
ncbi:MAG: hypothetical protein WC869_09215 [Phycisphaerae bacterium]